MKLDEWITSDYLDENKIKKLNQKFNSKFKHISIDNLFNEKKLLEIENELKNQEYYEENSDLYQFMRTEDFKKVKNKKLNELRNFFMSKEFIELIEKITNIKLIPNKISIHSLKLKPTHYLLCHDDNIENRKIAFILNFSNFKKIEGATLDLIAIDKNNNGKIIKQIEPKFNRFNIFEVTNISYHQITENLSTKNRITIGGWWY